MLETKTVKRILRKLIDFYYFDIDNTELVAKKEYFIKEWMEKNSLVSYSEYMEKENKPAFDSGLVRLETSPQKKGDKEPFEFIITSYRLLRCTIGRYSAEIENEKMSMSLIRHFSKMMEGNNQKLLLIYERLNKWIQNMYYHPPRGNIAVISKLLWVLFGKKSKIYLFNSYVHKIVYDKQYFDNRLAVGVGMVLSIVALRGSSTNKDNTPYILLVKRANERIRDDQLDAAVVEGINCADFESYNERDELKATLENIAIRALKEERGIHYDLLKNLGLIQMPKKYYLGLDKTYTQWNFFGTVKIDCTIEEIIRQGHYFSMDAFETHDIIGLPLKTDLIYYHLSENKIAVQREITEKEEVTYKGMWDAGWASLIFAFMDMGIKYKSNLSLLGWWASKKIGPIRAIGRNILNRMSNLFEEYKFVGKILEIIFIGSVVVITVIIILFDLILPILSTYISDIANAISLLTWIKQNMISMSTIINEKIAEVFISFFILISTFVIQQLIKRQGYINRSDFIYIKLNSLKKIQEIETNNSNVVPDMKQKDRINRTIEEIRVFRNVDILDGNIYNTHDPTSQTFREIYLARELEDTSTKKNQYLNQKYRIGVSRKCNLFESVDSWLPSQIGKGVKEHAKWTFITQRNEKIPIRLILVVVLPNNKILFRKSPKHCGFGELQNFVDININVDKIVHKDELVKINEISSLLSKDRGFLEIIGGIEHISSIRYKYLMGYMDLEGDYQYTIGGYILYSRNIDQKISHDNFVIQDMSYSITQSESGLKFDDPNRCVIELTIAELLGYQMSHGN